MIDRRLRGCPGWLGNLGGPVARVNRTTRTDRTGRRVAAVAGALGLAACATSLRDVPRDGASVREYLGDPSRAPAALEAIDSAPALVWRANAGRGTVGALAVGERVTAVATVDRWVYALDTRTGRAFWRYKGPSPYGAGPVMDAGHVYAASEGLDGKLTAIRLANGKRRWEARIGDVGGPLAVRDSTVYGATQSGTAFAYAASTGRRRWSRLAGASRSGPLVVGRWVALATLTDTLVVLDAATGTVVSRASLPASTVAPLARLDDSTVVMASPSGSVLALALPSGRVRWEVTTGAPVFGVPAVALDTVYALTNRCTVWAIPANAPTRPDTAAIGCVTEAGPTVVRGGVLVATIGGEVIYYDRAADRRVWTRTVRGELRHPPAVRNGQILIAPILGPVVSFR